MGIKNLHNFLRKACPLIYTEIHISHYAYKRVAVDCSIYMCKFKTTYGRQWMDAFLQLVTVLRENEVHPVFVYDTGHPVEKEEEKKMRTMMRLKTKEKADNLFKEWESYKAKYASSPEHFTGKDTSKPLPVSKEDMSLDLLEFLLKQDPSCVEEGVSVFLVDAALDHLLTTLLSIRSEDFELTRQLFRIMGIPYVMSTGEAEATCAVLCREGLVDAVLSEDTDVLNYRAPKFLHRLNVATGTVIEIDYQDMIDRLDLTPPQFLDFCIMCGTDYNTNIPKIGPEKSYRLLKKYGSLENIQARNPTLDMSNFPYVRVREIFMDDQHLPQEVFDAVTYTGIPDTHKLLEFCFQNNCRFDLPRLFQAFTTNTRIQFSGEEEEKTHLAQEETKPVQKSFLSFLS